jgi:prepilin-type N-terminal cleavage/methylation domain-containing protein
MNSTPHARSYGFTLMELLITLVLFSSLMTFLLNSFFQFNQQSRRMESILRLRQECRTLERIIRDDVASVVYLKEFMKDPMNERDGRKSGVLGINGSLEGKDSDIIHMHVHHRSRFYRDLPFERDPMLHEVSYFLEELESGEKRFKRREEFYLDADITDGDRSVVHTLSDHVVSFDVKYYKVRSVEPIDEWDSDDPLIIGNGTAKIPTAVSITLELVDESGEELKSELIVNLRPYMGAFVSWN